MATRLAAPYRAHEPTEVAWVLAALSPLGREQGGSFRRDTPYFAAVERWFAPYSTHAVIAALGPDFNLPRLVGNAADYAFDGESKLVRAAGAAALWDDAEGDLFTRYRAEIEDFSQKSRARRFLEAQAGTLARGHQALVAVVDVGDIKGWLETQFSERPAPVQLFVSPLTGGWNWTNLGGKTPRIWVPEPDAKASKDVVERFVTVASVFTEIDHIYVNPVTKNHMAAVEEAFGKARGWATDEAWANYPSGELVFNEYMTWAVFLEYAQERMPPAAYSQLESRIVRFMETRRGFVRFEKFIAVVRRVNGSQQQSLQDLFPAIISEAAKEQG